MAYEANVRAKPVLVEFDTTLARAEELLEEQPTRTTLTRIERFVGDLLRARAGSNTSGRIYRANGKNHFKDEPVSY